RHYARHFRGADAEHEAAEGAGRRRMRIAADREDAGPQVTVLGQHDVADALHVVEGGDTFALHPFAGEIEDRRTLRIDRRQVVVGGADDAARVPQLDAETLQHWREAPRAA